MSSNTRTSSPEVHIGGWVQQPLCLDVAALAARADRRPLSFTVICTFDGPHGGVRRMEGVPLTALIEAAQPAFEQRTDFKRVVLVAESIEGYRALFSWGEVFNTAVGEGVLVAWTEGQTAAGLSLVSLKDRATGPRFVQQLRSVSVHKVW